MDRNLHILSLLLIVSLIEQVLSSCSHPFSSTFCGSQPTFTSGSTNLCSNCLPCGNPNLPPLCPPECICQPKIDAVSLSLALQSQKDCIREDKLNFGANRLPIDGRYFKCPINVIEDGLHSLNRQVVELRPCCPRKSLAEEAAESYLEDDCSCCDCNQNICCRPYLTYSDVGYVPECPKFTPFVPGVPPPCPCSQGQVLYSGPAPSACQQCISPPIHHQCKHPHQFNNVYQPGGLYMTQKGGRNAACSPEFSCQC